jgi:hypothetical protein
MHAKWSRCPFCKAALDFEIKAGGIWGSNLGQPQITSCPKCNKPLADGKTEWAEMTILEKAREIALALFGTFIIAPLVGFIISLLIAVFVFKSHEGSILQLLWFGIPFSAWSAYSWVSDIRSSIKRTSAFKSLS